MDWMFVHLQNSYIETLPLSVMVLGDGLWEVIRIRWGHEGGVLVNGISTLRRVAGELASLSPSYEDARSRQSAARRRVSPEPDHAGI